ncbi:hypothetical protein BV25DRAFT_1814346 [Artomyces pyxidatus]|uniref:Uncharacterized protein n=1 Tax=Artomyces pyxidatus TaxID=48021 RepID=A0ACB8SIL2_9AGAM|nr:hypothetical protein BV25DRAFT_1814346 [Artomyces pyxidatus]
MSALLGLTSFGVGILPLSFAFSGKHMSRLSSLGTGLLLGTALGVIIPEGIETLAAASPAKIDSHTVALPLLVGFCVMLLVEQFSHGHGHAPHPRTGSAAGRPRGSVDVAFDVELSDLEDGPDPPRAATPTPAPPRAVEEDRAGPALPLTLGLVIHGLADGLALGVSALSGDGSDELSFLVFLALAVHKAPTALAFTLSLLSTSLSRTECRRHLLVFSASTPVGAVLSYSLFSFFGAGEVNRVGTALLVSGGSFLYVATVLQPVSHEKSGGMATEDIGPKTRTLLVTLGIFIPVVLGSFLEHHH